MMTGYGYNSNLVQPPPVLQEEWPQTGDQTQFFTGSGTTAMSNPTYYGSMGGWYQPPCYNFEEAANPQPPPVTNSFYLNPPALAPPPVPRVSISDEELYQALNMSPIPTSGYHQQQPPPPPPQQQQQQHAQIPQTDYLSSEVCYPSTSSSGYHDQGGYMPTMAEDPRHLHGHDGDDEESFGECCEPERLSPTFSIHSFAPTTSTNTAEAEDLEVELINHAKAAPRYQLPDNIDIFLHTGTTDDTEYGDDDDSRPTTTYSHRSTRAPTPPASRPAYAQKLTAAAQHLKPEQVQDASKTAPLFLLTTAPPGIEPPGFTPLLTPNSDALLQKKLSEVSYQLTGLSGFPAFPKQATTPEYFEAEVPQAPQFSGFYPYQSVGEPYTADYQFEPEYPVEDSSVPTYFSSFSPIPYHLPPAPPVSVPIVVPELLTSTTKPSKPSAPIKAPRLSDQELESESQKLAIDVISNLFTTKKDIVDRAAVINAPKKPVARNLFCDDKESMEKAKSDEPINMSVLDDWETADDEDLAGRMENLMKDAKKEEKKKQAALPKPTFLPSTSKSSDWDSSFLQHVLEIYGVPDYKMQEDVVKAMETIGFGDCKVMWMERKVVFAVFESVARAKNCLTLAKHDWLRFRALGDSPKTVQDFAKNGATSLALPKKKQQTTATVARRMVENALGKKATVTAEKRQEERNQLAAARAAKKNTIQWD